MEFILSHTSLAGPIPCDGVDACIATTVEHANSPASAALLESKVACLKNIRVSAEWFDGVMNASTALSVDRGAGGGEHLNGTVTILESVCTCDVTWGLAGENCTETASGTALKYYLMCIMVWILYLVARLATKLARREFKTRRKRGLASFAVTQYCGHLLWLVGCKPFRWLFQAEYLRLSFLLIGYVLVTVTVFMMVCGMLLETSSLVRRDAKSTEAHTVKLLLALDKVFRVLPVFVTLATLGLCVIFTPFALTLLAIIQSCGILAVAGAFTVTTNALDRRIHRLMPPKQTSKSWSGLSSFSRRQHKQRQTIHRGTLADGAQGLLDMSKKLRNVSSWMRSVALVVVLTGNCYVFVFMEFNAALGVLPQVLAGIAQIAQAAVPFIALEGIVKQFKFTNTMIFAAASHARGLRLTPNESSSQTNGQEPPSSVVSSLPS